MEQRKLEESRLAKLSEIIKQEIENQFNKCLDEVSDEVFH